MLRYGRLRYGWARSGKSRFGKTRKGTVGWDELPALFISNRLCLEPLGR